MKELLGRLALALGSVLLVLALAEAALRAADYAPERYKSTARLVSGDERMLLEPRADRGVLHVRQQIVVHGVEHLLVQRHFGVEIRLVELGAGLVAQVLHDLLRVLAQLLRGIVTGARRGPRIALQVSRVAPRLGGVAGLAGARDARAARQLPSLLVGAAVIAHHRLRELLHGGRLRAARRVGAVGAVERVRRHRDLENLCVRPLARAAHVARCRGFAGRAILTARAVRVGRAGGAGAFGPAPNGGA